MTDDRETRIEELLLIKLCRLEFTDALKAEIGTDCKNITDWKYFVSAANEHGIPALVYSNLENLGLLEYIPAKTAQYFRNALLMSMSRNAVNMKVMGEILSLLNKENMKTVLLKGMALEIMMYGNRGLRQMTDADVLMSREESLKAFRMLKRNGFTPLPVKSGLHKLILIHIGKHLPSLIKSGFSLEIHHELFGTGNSQMTSTLKDTSRSYDLNGQAVYLPQPQILFIYLLGHLHNHELNNDSQLRLYTDLVVLIDKYGDEIINPELTRICGSAGMDQVLSDRLLILRQFWKITFPGWLNEYIDDKASENAISRFMFFLKSPKNNPQPDRSQSYSPMLKGIPGLHRKIIYVIGDVFPTITFMKKRYNCTSAWKAVLYYPHRFGKLIWLFRK